MFLQLPSYIQRAGRAGRRKDGISAAITFCRNLPHDQYNYQHPHNIIQGAVPAPFLNIANIPLAQRHCNSLLLRNFLRDISLSETESIELIELIKLDFKKGIKMGIAALTMKEGYTIEDIDMPDYMESMTVLKQEGNRYIVVSKVKFFKRFNRLAKKFDIDIIWDTPSIFTKEKMTMSQ